MLKRDVKGLSLKQKWERDIPTPVACNNINE